MLFLEIEGLGLEEEEVEEALLSYFLTRISRSLRFWRPILGITEDDALYLAEVLDLSHGTSSRNNKASAYARR